MKFTEQLHRAVQRYDSCLCVGLDPYPDQIPQIFDDYDTLEERVLAFLREVIDCTHHQCAAYKPNLAFFEAIGPTGIEIFNEILDYIPDDKVVIADVKRGDINTSSAHYCKSYFETFDVDAVTLNPLMGFETLAPYVSYPAKGVYVLTLTSNPGASDFLMKPFSDFDSMAEYIASSLHDYQRSSDTHIGMVVGATQTGLLKKVIQHHPEASLLIPGIGKQGGSINSLVRELENHTGIPLISSSRSILYPGGKPSDWKASVTTQAKTYKELLEPITERYA